MKLTDLKGEVLTTIESLGLSEEHLKAVKSGIDTLTSAHNSNAEEKRLELESKLETEKKSITTLSEKLKQLETTPPAKGDGVNVKETDEYKLLAQEHESLQTLLTEQKAKDDHNFMYNEVKKELESNAIMHNEFMIKGLMNELELSSDRKVIKKNEDGTINLIDSYIGNFAKENTQFVKGKEFGGTSVAGEPSSATFTKEKYEKMNRAQKLEILQDPAKREVVNSFYRK